MTIIFYYFGYKYEYICHFKFLRFFFVKKNYWKLKKGHIFNESLYMNIVSIVNCNILENIVAFFDAIH